MSEQADAKVALLNSNIWQLGLIIRGRVQWLSDYQAALQEFDAGEVGSDYLGPEAKKD